MGSPIFISYSHRDAVWLERLQTYLKPFVRDMEIDAWDDRKIAPGDNWRAEIDKALASAKVAVLLVSQDFLASDFIHQHELPYIYEAAKSRKLSLCWIPVSYSSYINTPLENYQSLGDPRTPLDDMSEPDMKKQLVGICSLIANKLVPTPTPTPTDGPAPPRPAPVPIEPAARSAREGIKALIELMSNPEVQSKVAVFRVVFEGSCRQIEVLGFYKDLHDLLHTLQFRCYNYLVQVVSRAKNFPDDTSVWDSVIDYELMLQDIAKELEEASRRQPPSGAAATWVTGLVESLKQLFAAVESHDAESIHAAIQPIQKVLARQPARLNDRLDEAARALPLAALVDALKGVCDSLDQRQVNQTTLLRFSTGVEALNDLAAGLSVLNVEHGKWQEIDSEIRLFESGVSKDVSELVDSWPGLKALTQSQCGGVADEWARLLAEEVRKLDEAIGADEQPKIRQYFQRYRTRVNNRFYQVDLNLKELCEKLRTVGEPLATVWEIIQ